jgi:hypothetical protein
MKLISTKAKLLVTACVLTLQTMGSSAEVLFKDDFEGGNLAAQVASAKWLDKADVSVSSTVVKSGKYAAKFHFTGNTSADEDSWSELRFDLGKLNTELWMQYDLYIPANYKHRGPGNNNKFLRLWGNDYADYEKIGISTWATSSNIYSSLQGDWNSTGGGIGPSGDLSSDFINATDLGKWMTVKIYVKAPTASARGTMKVWKNGVIKLDNTGEINNYNAANPHAYRYGYLLGWANSGFAQDTDMYIDNVVFGTKETDISATVASPPMAPTLRVQ